MNDRGARAPEARADLTGGLLRIGSSVATRHGAAPAIAEGGITMYTTILRAVAAGAMLAVLLTAVPAGAETLTDTVGDSKYERVYFGYGGAGRENLSDLLSGYTDPLTGQPSPIVAPDGSQLVVGNVELGENPSASHQTQIQRFFTTTDQQYRLTYLGLGYASYRNILGVYSYAVGEDDPDQVFYEPLVTQGVTDPGTEVLFDVPADHFFGFYLSTDGARQERNRFFSENTLNLDGGGRGTDHMLLFDTNRGYLMAWEDLPLSDDGKLGDQDYEDLIGGLLTYGDGSPIPEPATMALIGAGFGALAVRMMRHGRKRE